MSTKATGLIASKDLKEELGQLENIGRLVAVAEERARNEQKKVNAKFGHGNNRQYAQALHREADGLYHSGDYETALVLYHRAANLCPRDNSHGVAARRTAATITTWNNSTKNLKKLFTRTKNESALSVAVCPETAASMASDVLRDSVNASKVSEVLCYFENHKSYWKNTPGPVSKMARENRSRVSLKQLTTAANATLKNLEDHFESGDMCRALKIGQELLSISSGLVEPQRHRIAACHYLSLIHVSFGRHDRAVSSVTEMIRLAKGTGDPHLISRSLVTLGKVHLSFGHLDAAARAWESLVDDLEESIPLAWLHHEIGRCHLETGRYRRAFDMANRCVRIAESVDSKKWLLHGKLLSGQALLELGRFAEALEALRESAKITEEEGDTPTLCYVQDLVGQVNEVLRRITKRTIVETTVDQDLRSISQKEDNNPEERVDEESEKDMSTTMITVSRQDEARIDDHFRDREFSSSEEYGDEEYPTSVREPPRSGVQLESIVGDEHVEEGDPQGGSTYRLSSLRTCVKKDHEARSRSYSPDSSSHSHDPIEPILHQVNEVKNYSDIEVIDASSPPGDIPHQEISTCSPKEGEPYKKAITSKKIVKEEPALSSKINLTTRKEKLSSNDRDWLDALNMLDDPSFCDIEERDKLLEIIRQTLLVSEDEARAFQEFEKEEEKGLRECCEENREDLLGLSSSRSWKQEEGSMRTAKRSCGRENAHSLYRHSLPSSPRRQQGHPIVSRTCEGFDEFHGVLGKDLPS